MLVRGAGRPVPRLIHRLPHNQVGGVHVVGDVGVNRAYPVLFSDLLADHLVLRDEDRPAARLAQGAREADPGGVAEQADLEPGARRDIKHLPSLLE